MAIDVDLSRYAVDGAARVDSFSRMNPRFSTALADMFAAAPADIRSNLRVSSGFRSVERQEELFEAALAKYGSPEAARKWVAPPGHSQHNHGNAADLKYLSPAALDWAHKNAAKFGLAFPLSNENWHIELADARNGDPESATVLAAALAKHGVEAGAATTEPSPLDEMALASRARSAGKPSFEEAVGLFLLTQHEPPKREVDEKTATEARRKTLLSDQLLNPLV